MNMGRQLIGDFNVLAPSVGLLSLNTDNDNGLNVTLPCTGPVVVIGVPVRKPREEIEYVRVIDRQVLKIKCPLGIEQYFEIDVKAPIGIRLIDVINVKAPLGIELHQTNRVGCPIQFMVYDPEVLKISIPIGIQLRQVNDVIAPIGKTVDDSIKHIKRILEYLRNL